MAQTSPVDDAMLRDPYEVLGVDRGATSQEIKSACELLRTFSSLLQALAMYQPFPLGACSSTPIMCQRSSVLCNIPGLALPASSQWYLKTRRRSTRHGSTS